MGLPVEACFGISAPNSLVGLDPAHTMHRSSRPDTETPIPKDRPLRVLHLCAGNLYGGIETMLMTMVRNRRLCPAMESEFLLCFSGRFEDELRAAGGRVHRVPEVRIRHPWTLLKARWELQRILETERFDVALAHGNWQQAVLGPVVRRRIPKLVHFLHNPLEPRSWLARWARRTPIDLLVANSRFVAGSAGLGYPGIPVGVCHCPVEAGLAGVSEKERIETRADHGTSKDDVVILQASRMEEWKGLRVHVEALGRLRDVPGWVSWIAGGAQLERERRFFQEVQDRATALGVSDRIRFLGQRRDVNRLFAAADIHCQPNTGPEPFGIAFVEALYAGLPVVTSNFGGGAEIVDESCGILTPPGDVEGVASALRLLITDPVRRRQLGSQGPTRAARISNPGQQLEVLCRLLVVGA